VENWELHYLILITQCCIYSYFAVVLNFRQYWALYGLVEWYAAMKDELAHIKPLAKFLSFKSIVFLTWWQGVIIAIMYSLGLVYSVSDLVARCDNCHHVFFGLG
jgi:hypothetical protein